MAIIKVSPAAFWREHRKAWHPALLAAVTVPGSHRDEEEGSFSAPVQRCRRSDLPIYGAGTYIISVAVKSAK